MKKMKTVISILLFCFFIFVSCKSNETHESSVIQENYDEDGMLKVYMICDELSGSSGNFYFSAYSMGEMRGRALQWGNAGHIYYDAMKEFESETGVKLDITYFDYSEDMFLQLEQDIQNNTPPDVVVGDGNTEYYDVYKYMNADYFVELDGYMGDNENAYYERVLTAGEMGNHQYIFPLMFNLNVMMASESIYLTEDVEISNGESYTGIVKKMIALLEQTKDRESVASISQLSNHMPNYPFIIFDSASGENLIDYEAEKVIVDQEYINLLYDFEKARLMQEYGDLWEEAVASAVTNNNVLPYQKSKSNYFRKLLFEDMFFEDIYDLNILLLEGGGYATVSYHSALAQATYFNSQFKDMRDDLVCIGIPTYKDAASYTANVCIYAGIPSGCRDVDMAFRFIKHLADYEIPWQMGFSVNKMNTQKMIEERKSSIYAVYPGVGTYDPERENDEESLKGDPYYIKELDEELCNYFLMMLDNVGVATLSDGNTRMIVYNHILDGILKQKTKEEVYQKICEELNTYIEIEICS